MRFLLRLSNERARGRLPLDRARIAAIDAADLALSDAGVAELVDALDLGSSIERCGGSSPFARTSPAPPKGGATVIP